MVKIKYLNSDQLQGFERYKYNSVDTSYLSVYVMHPFWNYCVQFFPKWIAPNLITFTGFLLTVVNFLLIGYYDYGFTAATLVINPIPRWVWLLASINIFLAYTLDGIDGKQARRTGTSGPLGELFDHGLDSYTSVLIPIYMFSLFGIKDLPPIRMHFIIWIVFLNFYLTHFEKYNTGVMFLPWAYDFTMWGVTLTLAITFMVGTAFWTTPFYGNILPVHCFEVVLYVSGSITSHPIIIMNIYRSYKNRTGKMRPIAEALRPLLPFTILFMITTIWVLFSRNNICNLEPRLMFTIFGTVFSNICCRLIVAQMSDTRAEGFNLITYPVLLATICSTFPFYKQLGMTDITENTERMIIYVFSIVVTVAHLHYGQGVIKRSTEETEV